MMHTDRLDPDMAVVVSVMSGAIGLWAVLYSNARAAKLFLRSQALVYLMNRVHEAIHAIARPHSNTSNYWTTFALTTLFHVVFGMYRLKVGLVLSALHVFFILEDRLARPCLLYRKKMHLLRPRDPPPGLNNRDDRYSSIS